MGITSILFIVVLLILSGVVAWVGDVVGRQIGKRRIAFLGLRPRRTSVLIAVVTGMVITALTILALALVNETVRDMLVRIDEIRRERGRLISERDQARATIDTMKGTIEEGRQAIEFQRMEIEGLTGTLSTAQEELTGLQERLAELEGEAQRYEAQIAGLNRDISAREARLGALNQQIEILNQQVLAMWAGEVKVYEGQQLAVFLVDTHSDEATLNSQLVTMLGGIPHVYRDLETGEQVLLSNEVDVATEDYRQAIQEIRAMPSERAVVIAYAAANVFEDEPVPLRIEVTGYYRVYPAGTLIYSDTVYEPAEATQPYRARVASFFDDARNYLVNERNIIPTSLGEVMQLTIDDVLGLAERLSDVGFPAELRMVALTDIFRTDFLVYGEQFTVNILPAPEEELE